MTSRDGLTGPSEFLIAQCDPCHRPLPAGSLNDRDLVATGRAPGETAHLDWIGSNRKPDIDAETGAAVASNKDFCTNREWCPECLVASDTLGRAGRTETLTGQAAHTSRAKGSRTRGPREEGQRKGDRRKGRKGKGRKGATELPGAVTRGHGIDGIDAAGQAGGGFVRASVPQRTARPANACFARRAAPHLHGMKTSSGTTTSQRLHSGGA